MVVATAYAGGGGRRRRAGRSAAEGRARAVRGQQVGRPSHRQRSRGPEPAARAGRDDPEPAGVEREKISSGCMYEFRLPVAGGKCGGVVKDFAGSNRGGMMTTHSVINNCACVRSVV